MRASAHIVAVLGTDGATRLDRMSGEPPLLVRRTNPGAGPTAEVYLVGGAAGPLGGDRLEVWVEVGPGATLRLGTVAASIALPGPTGDRSRVEVHARVASGGRLEWLPEPLVAAAGCDHEVMSTVDLDEGAALVWRDELVCGRHGERPGDVRQATRLRIAGRTLYHHELSVGPKAPGWDGPAVLHSARATGTMVVVDPRWSDAGPPPPAVTGTTAARMPLGGPAVVITAVGADAPAVRASLLELGAAYAMESDGRERAGGREFPAASG